MQIGQAKTVCREISLINMCPLSSKK